MDFNVFMCVWLGGTLVTIGLIMGYSLASDHEDGAMYLLFLAPAWPVLWIIVPVAVLAFKVRKWIET